MSEEKKASATPGAAESNPPQPPTPEPAPPEARPRWYKRIAPRRKLLLPLLTLGLLAIILVTFHSILLPFIFACVIAYLMEPIVRRMAVKLPRWVAVITVYLSFFGILSLGFIFMVPRFIQELARFAETVPETVAQFRSENLPGINHRVQQFLREYLAVAPSRSESGREEARMRVHGAWQRATSLATATAVVRTRARAAANMEFQVDRRRTAELRNAQKKLPPAEDADSGDDPAPPLQVLPVYRGVLQAPQLARADFQSTHGAWVVADQSERPLVRLVPGSHGDFEVYLGDADIVVTQLEDNSWRIRRPEPPESGGVTHTDMQASLIDLEARVNEMIESAVSTSHERVASLISYTHVLVVGIIQALVTIILTFMVAAFMSIDMPRFVGFFREIFPADYRPGFDDLLVRIDRGLSGVIRGQLIICLINGVLTYIGLLFLNIKFSLMLALLAGVLSLIPVFGTIISTIPIVLVGLMNGFWTGFLALCWILVIHFVEANILNPQIIGTSAHIHPVIVIFALLAGEHAFGLVGALLAVPSASILLEIFHFTRAKMIAEDAAVDPAVDPAADGALERSS